MNSLQDVARKAAVTAHDSLLFSETSGVDQTLYRIADAVLAAVLAEQAKESPKLVKDSRRSSCWAVGFPDTERKVCELPFGHDGYHRQGAISWLGYHQPLAPPQTPEPCDQCRNTGVAPAVEPEPGKLQDVADSTLRRIALQYGSTTRRDFRVIEIVLSEMEAKR